VVEPTSARDPRFLIELQPRYTAFFGNVAALLVPHPRASSATAPFWPDVFVRTGIPWGKLLLSTFYHVLCVAAVLAWSNFVPQRTRMLEQTPFQRSDVVTYSASDYLPPLDTGGSKASITRKGDPALSAQPIISVPPEADNRRQTIVVAPRIKLDRELALPNIIEVSRAPLPAPPIAIANAKLPALPTPVVAPPPDITPSAHRRIPQLPQTPVAPTPEIAGTLTARAAPAPAIVEPPPSVTPEVGRKVGDINIGPADVVAPAPELPVALQRTRRQLGHAGSAAEVVAPPPSFTTSDFQPPAANLIALNVEPSPPDAVVPPAGNRRGEFAATPNGRVGGAGTPDIPRDHSSSSAGRGNGGTGSEAGSSEIPPGLFVGTAPSQSHEIGNGGRGGNGNAFSSTPDVKRLIADATRSRIGSIPRKSAAEVPEQKVTDIERQVFRDRKLYSMMLNLPNLNSAGGSWIMHFAELEQPRPTGDLTPPVPTQAVDPAYPTELMRENVQGTVTLYAVIHSDGHVSDVRVLQGVDDRLDRYATAALTRWRFRPATKNGSAVALEAVVSIPFRSAHREF